MDNNHDVKFKFEMDKVKGLTCKALASDGEEISIMDPYMGTLGANETPPEEKISIEGRDEFGNIVVNKDGLTKEEFEKTLINDMSFSMKGSPLDGIGKKILKSLILKELDGFAENLFQGLRYDFDFINASVVGKKDRQFAFKEPIGIEQRCVIYVERCFGILSLARKLHVFDNGEFSILQKHVENMAGITFSKGRSSEFVLAANASIHSLMKFHDSDKNTGMK